MMIMCRHGDYRTGHRIRISPSHYPSGQKELGHRHCRNAITANFVYEEKSVSVTDKFTWDDGIWTSPEAHREYFCRIWSGAKEGKIEAFTSEERKLVSIMFEHPEYRRQFEMIDSVGDHGIDPAPEANPFIHVAMHSVIENQLASKKPIEVYQFYLALRKKKLNHHDALHLLMAIMAPLIFKVVRSHEAFDEGYYVRLLRKFMEKKPEKIWKALEQEFADCYTFDVLDEKPEEEIPELDPEVAKQLERALTLISKKKIDAADKIVCNLLENHADIDLVQFMAGYVLMERQNPVGALARFDKAIELNPNSIDAWFHKGLLFEKLADIGEAIIAHRKVLELADPKDPLVEVSREILEDYAQTLKEKGTTPDGYIRGKEIFEHAVTAMEKHKWEEAITGLGKTISIHSRHVQSYGNLGICYGYLGRKKEALEAFDKALEIDPLYEPAIKNRALIRNLQEGEKPSSELKIIDFYENRSKAGAAGDFLAKDLGRLMGQQEFSSLKEAQEFADRYIEKFNETPSDDFHGLSPRQMSRMINEPFTAPNLVSFSAAPESAAAPIMRLFNLLVDAIGDKGMKPTAKGNLPRNFCREAAFQFYGEEEYRRQREIFSINTERDFIEMHVTRITAELAGFVRKYGGRLILSRSYLNLREKDGPNGAYPRLLEAYTRKFNWGYQDGYPDLQIVQDSFLFTLFLLSRYGGDWKTNPFYEDLFLRAFPAVVKEVAASPWRTAEEMIRSCYSLRCLERFAGFMGLIDIRWESEKRLGQQFELKKLPLLDEAVRFHL